jgi:hypothetical protein
LNEENLETFPLKSGNINVNQSSKAVRSKKDMDREGRSQIPYLHMV